MLVPAVAAAAPTAEEETVIPAAALRAAHREKALSSQRLVAGDRPARAGLHQREPAAVALHGAELEILLRTQPGAAGRRGARSLAITSGIHQRRRRRVGLARIAPAQHLSGRAAVRHHVGRCIDPQQQTVGENVRRQHGGRHRTAGIQRQRALLDRDRAAGEVRRRHGQTPRAKFAQRPGHHQRVRLGRGVCHHRFHGLAVPRRGHPHLHRPRRARRRAHTHRDHPTPHIPPDR